MARAISASGRPLNGDGMIVTSPNGIGGCTRRVTRRLILFSSSNLGFVVASERANLTLVPCNSSDDRRMTRIVKKCRPRRFPRTAFTKLSKSGVPRQRDYFSGWPMVTVSLLTPSTSHSILSPATVAATPDGVPVMMMSPEASSTISESFEMISGTFQII
jgi:hypothetical protein